MVHEIEGGVPEELYNLTQLAEVSLAAGKLPQPASYREEEFCTYPMNHKSNMNFDKNINGVESYQDNDNKVLNYSTTNTTSTKKKWKNEWEESCYQRTNSTVYPAANMFNINTLSGPHMNNHALLTTNSYQHHLQNYDSPYGSATMMNNNQNIDTSRRNSLVSTSSSLASSSDDDSSLFSYSHKVFDRKKVRRNIDYGAHCPNNSADNTNSMTNSTESDQGSVESGAEEIHTCPECGKKYSTSSNLARHRQTHR